MSFWKVIAWLVSRPAIADYLIARAQRTPYFHLRGYMERFWLFNGYSSDQGMGPEERRKAKRFPWLPYSIRIHHILRADEARHLHDHPWDARTIILQGWYVENRRVPFLGQYTTKEFTREQGDTATLKYGEYHEITQVSQGGVWTLFIVGDFKGDWGFLVDRVKIPHDQYEDELES